MPCCLKQQNVILTLCHFLFFDLLDAALSRWFWEGGLGFIFPPLSLIQRDRLDGKPWRWSMRDYWLEEALFQRPNVAFRLLGIWSQSSDQVSNHLDQYVRFYTGPWGHTGFSLVFRAETQALCPWLLYFNPSLAVQLQSFFPIPPQAVSFSVSFWGKTFQLETALQVNSY